MANNLTINGTLSLSELIDLQGNLTNNGTISSTDLEYLSVEIGIIVLKIMLIQLAIPSPLMAP